MSCYYLNMNRRRWSYQTTCVDYARTRVRRQERRQVVRAAVYVPQPPGGFYPTVVVPGCVPSPIVVIVGLPVVGARWRGALRHGAGRGERGRGGVGGGGGARGLCFFFAWKKTGNQYAGGLCSELNRPWIKITLTVVRGEEDALGGPSGDSGGGGRGRAPPDRAGQGVAEAIVACTRRIGPCGFRGGVAAGAGGAGGGAAHGRPAAGLHCSACVLVFCERMQCGVSTHVDRIYQKESVDSQEH